MVLQEFEKMLENMNLSEEKKEPLRLLHIRNTTSHSSQSQ